jgi:hypothetical protein
MKVSLLNNGPVTILLEKEFEEWKINSSLI